MLISAQHLSTEEGIASGMISVRRDIEEETRSILELATKYLANPHDVASSNSGEKSVGNEDLTQNQQQEAKQEHRAFTKFS